MSKSSVPMALALLRKRLAVAPSNDMTSTVTPSEKQQREFPQLLQHRTTSGSTSTPSQSSDLSLKLSNLRSTLSKPACVQLDDATTALALKLAHRIKNPLLSAAIQKAAAESVALGKLVLLPDDLWRQSNVPQHYEEESVGIFGRSNPGRRLRATRNRVSDVLLSEVGPDGRRVCCPPGEVSPLAESSKHFYFVLWKEGIPLSEAISVVAEASGLPAMNFRVAVPPLDPSTCTAQLCSIASTDSSVIQNLEKVNHGPHRGVRIQQLGFSRKEMGSVAFMNSVQFALLLRAMVHKEATIATCTRASLQRGFVNFFGLKKFGFQLFKSFHIGECAYKGQFRLALLMIAQNALLSSREMQVAYRRYLQHSADKNAFRSFFSEVPWLEGLLANLEARKVRERDYELLYHRYIPRSLQMSFRVGCAAVEWNLAASLFNYRRRRVVSRHRTVDGQLCLFTDRVPASAISPVEMKWELEPDGLPDWCAVDTSMAPPRPEIVEPPEGVDTAKIVIPYGNWSANSVPSFCADAVLARRCLNFSSASAVPLGCRSFLAVPQRTSYRVIPEFIGDPNEIQLISDVQNRCSVSSSRSLNFEIDQFLPEWLLDSLLHSSTSAPTAATQSLAVQGTIPATSYLSSLLREFVSIRIPASAATRNGVSECAEREDSPETAPAVAVHSEEAARGFLGMKPSPIDCYE